MPRAVHLAILDVTGGAPTLPAASLVRESGGWYTARRGRHVLHVYDAGRLADGRAICALVGRPSRALVGAVVTLPTPLPGTALPWTLGPLRVDALVGPALPATIAGHRDDEDAETGGPLIDGE